MILRRCVAGACLLFVGVLALGGSGTSPAQSQGGGCAPDQFGAVASTNSTRDGAISGDGTKIAFIETGPNIGGNIADQLVVANYDGTNPQVVASDHQGTDAVLMGDPELNYDGSVVAVGWRPVGTGSYKSFAVIDVAAPSNIEINNGFQPRLSNDGTKVAVRHIVLGQVPGITVYDLNAGTEVFIEEGPDQRIYSSDLSGDGTTLAYGRRDTVGVTSTYRVAVVDVASQTEIELVDDAASFPLNISDDGSTVFFYSYAANSHAVRQGGTDTLITSMGVPQTRFGVIHQNFGYYNEVMSADGSKIVYTAELEDPYRTVFIEQIDIATDSVSASLYLEDPADGFVRHMETSADGAASILPSSSPLLADPGGNFYRWSACTGGMPPAPTATATPLPSPETPSSVTLDYETGQSTDGIPKLRSSWAGVNDNYEVLWFRGLTEAEIIAGGFSVAVASDTVVADEATIVLAPYAATGPNDWCVTVAGMVDTNVSSPSAPVCFNARVCDDHYVTVRLLAGDTPTIGNDVIQGTNGNDFIEALDGIDRVCALAGDDTVDGGAGNDRLFGNGGDDALGGGDGRDRILGGSGNDIIGGGAGHDMIIAGSGDDRIGGGGGQDRIEGGSGADKIDGQAANDRLYGEAGNDLIEGGGGNDRMYGGDGDDEIEGEQGRQDRAWGGAANDFCDAEHLNPDCENIKCGIDHSKALGIPGLTFTFTFDCVHLTENFQVYFNPQTVGLEADDPIQIYPATATELGVKLEAALETYSAPMPWNLPLPLMEDDRRLSVYIRPAPPAPGYSPPNHIEIASEKIGVTRDLNDIDFIHHEVFHQFQWQIEGITSQFWAGFEVFSWVETHAEWAACPAVTSSGYCDKDRTDDYLDANPEVSPWIPESENYQGVLFFRYIESVTSTADVVAIVSAASDFEPVLFDKLGPDICSGQTCAHELHDWRTLVGPNFLPGHVAADRTIVMTEHAGGAVFQDLDPQPGTVAIVHDGLSPIDITVISDTGPALLGFPKTGDPCSQRVTTSPATNAGVMFVDFPTCANARVVATNIGTDDTPVLLLDVTDLLPTGEVTYNYPMPISIVGAFNMGTIRADVLCDALGLTGYHAEPGATTGEIASADNWDNYVSCWGGTINVQSLEAAVDVTEDDEDLCVRRDPVAVSAGGTHREFTFSTAPCV